jgi:thiol-disulfide isomerase/thioredoxin
MSPPTRILCAILLGVAAAAARAELKPGDPFPSLAKSDLTDGRVPATGGKVVLVDFWASWCAPCRASFPAYAKLQSDYASRDLLIVAVSVDQDPAAFAAFRERYQPPFVTVLDQSQQLVRQVDVPAMPTCYLVGRDQRVRYVHRGYHGAETERELRREIDQLLAESIALQ